MVPMVEAANPEATCIDGGKGSSYGWNITSEAKPGQLCHTLTKTTIPFTCCFTVLLIYPNTAQIEQCPRASLELPQRLQPSDKIRTRQADTAA